MELVRVGTTRPPDGAVATPGASPGTVQSKRGRGRPRGSHDAQPRAKRNWTVDNPPDHVVRLVRWYVHERVEGETIKDWGAAEGRTPQYMSLLMHDPRVLVLLEQALRDSNAGPIKVQAVLDMLHRRATKDDDVKAATVYLNAVGAMAPRRSQVDVNISDVRGLSDQQLHVELQRAIALLEGRAPSEPVMEAEVIEDTVVDNATSID